MAKFLAFRQGKICKVLGVVAPYWTKYGLIYYFGSVIQFGFSQEKAPENRGFELVPAP
jgi:hypothetical protein